MNLFKKLQHTDYIIIISSLCLLGIIFQVCMNLEILTEHILYMLIALVFIIPLSLFILVKKFTIGVILIILLQPFENLLGIGGFGSIVRYITILTIVGFVTQNLLKKTKLTTPKNSIFNDSIFKLIFILLAWSFVSIAWSTNTGRALSYSLTFLNNFSLFCLVISSKIHSLKLYWIASITGNVLSIFLSPLLPRPQGLINVQERFTTGGQDPNDLAGFLLINITICLYVMYPKINSLGGKIITVLSIIVMAIGVILTLSRTGIIGLCIPLIVLLIRQFTKPIYSVLAIALFVIIYFFINDIIPFIINSDLSLLARFNNPTHKGLLDDRWYVWEAAINTIKENFFLGVGAGNLPYVIDDYSSVVLPRSSYNENIGITAHNIILSVWAELGCVGVSIFILILTISIKRAFKLIQMDKWGLGLLVSLLVVIFFGLTLSWETKKIIYILLSSVTLIWRHHVNIIEGHYNK